ncbi:hypothetical protein [Sphingomonas sp. KR3-1]|uniref:hypothetical protein n=1 Tax=Sphingomonas sp. KR3-1 TaxID=3156611 RepID=UPI0032B4C8D2
MSDPADDDPLEPRRWTARGGEGGPITGDEYAYLKDLVHARMGVGKTEPEPAHPRGWRALLRRLRKT